MRHITDITLGRLLGLSQGRIARTYIKRDQEEHGHLPDIIDRGPDFTRHNKGKPRYLLPPGAVKAFCVANPGFRGVPRIIAYVERITGQPWDAITATPRGAAFKVPGISNPHGRKPGKHTPCTPPAPMPKVRSQPIPAPGPPVAGAQPPIQIPAVTGELKFFEFNGDQLPCLWVGEEFYGFIAYTAEVFGMKAAGQVEHIKNQHYSMDKATKKTSLRTVSAMLPGDTQHRNYLIAPQEVFFFWITRINTNRVASWCRPLLEDWQKGMMKAVTAFCNLMMNDIKGARKAVNGAYDDLKSLLPTLQSIAHTQKETAERLLSITAQQSDLASAQTKNTQELRAHSQELRAHSLRLLELERARTRRAPPAPRVSKEQKEYDSALNEIFGKH